MQTARAREDLQVLAKHHELYDSPNFFKVLVDKVIRVYWSPLPQSTKNAIIDRFKEEHTKNGELDYDEVALLSSSIMGWVQASQLDTPRLKLLLRKLKKATSPDCVDAKDGEDPSDELQCVSPRQRAKHEDTKKYTKIVDKKDPTKQLYVRTRGVNVDSSCTPDSKHLRLKRRCPSSMLTDDIVLSLARAGGVRRLKCDSYSAIRKLAEARLNAMIREHGGAAQSM